MKKINKTLTPFKLEQIQTIFKNWVLLSYAIMMVTVLSCSPKLKPTVLQLTTRQAIIIQNKCIDHRISGLFGETGSIQCEDILLEYKFGQNIDQGPLSPKEEFNQLFKGYYYHKFFEKVYLDEKVHKLFIDSVQLIKLTPFQYDKEYLFNCPGCNAAASLKFKNKIYEIPYNSTIDPANDNQYLFTLDTFDIYERKIFLSKNPELSSGVYLSELKNKKSSSKLLITSIQSNEPDRLLQLFKKISLLKMQNY
ncbi:MAG: hypothetical protein IPM42_15710 [Saprospiraceae bacterium]|nr:hypothetical protein [Saprospiraceae bacterium]